MELEASINASIFYFLRRKEKSVFESYLRKSNCRVQKKNEVDSYGLPVLHLIIVPLI
jgi:hypothetical protein